MFAKPNKNNKFKGHKLPRWSKESENPFNKIDSSYKKNEAKNIERANKVKDAMKFAWDSYKANAWGHDEWLPTREGNSDWLGGFGLSIVDSLDTLKIMGLQEELNDGKDWVKRLNHVRAGDKISVFEANIRYLGSYLAMYDLTGDEVYKNKAKEFGDILMHSFGSDPFPASFLGFLDHETRIPGWTGSCVILSEFGTMSLEFSRLSDITGDPKYKKKTDGIIQALMKMKPQLKGLYPVFISQDGKRFCNNQVSIGAMGDSYYEYLLKMWMYTDGREELYSKLFEEAADSIIEHLYKVSPGGNGYISTYEYGSTSKKQEHLTCFAGGMFALAAASGISSKDNKNKHYMEVGAEITRTCAQTYLESPSGLGAEIFVFEDNGKIRQSGPGTTTWYFLRPETVESIFILWRLTGDEKYQEWGWKIFEAIEKYCRLENGYAGLKDVNNIKDIHQDEVQQSFFMAETLKYIYLIFKDSNTIPLDKYVFNTEAHPFLINY
ncbi:hypothetical protein DICPUDRAFT_55071 [Dictyostelium purpureum]|uniref:alpha-1,2-Mannosidase n=1 Tax=Dictyostelium purpureum TaxID=5786 RepID=F0ZK85_DICPU|nr:uncharacterized protein DICPUDRAFT_55071 [Dictyostelium purpureum]EGC35642.1 hypothetical protein DICPUDRAFT_55071 [Dictyostelium purpureum]|eukprot:XP_003287821.1 hypothetical protein DICPUDRAFT_55071 [Dictyostelium purpureum]